MVSGNLKKDIFDDTLVASDGTKQKIIQFVKDTVIFSFDDMRDLYYAIKKYEELCSDIGRCGTESTKKLIFAELEDLRGAIKRYYVVRK